MSEDGPLAGLKVLDCGHFVSAPYCTKLMADMGAEVIKVEEPGKGDKSRDWGPFTGDIPHPERSGLFLYLNTNKLDVTINLKNAIGKEIFYKLVKDVDILVENNPPQLMAELGLDYQTISKRNLHLIMTSITPFGQSGPYRNYKASELVLVQMSGVGHGTPGEVEDISKEPPLKSRALEIGFMAGTAGAGATMTALFARQASGQGQHVDVSEQEAAAWVGMANFAHYLYGYPNPVRDKRGRFPRAPMHDLPCKDGYVHLECLEEHQWSEFVDLMGNPEWAQNELFQSGQSRANYWDALGPLVIELIKGWSKEDLSREAQAKGIPCTPVMISKDLLSSEQLAARGFFVAVDHPDAGKFLYPGAPYQLSETPWKIRHPAPLLGEHNEEVFCQRLGYTREDLARMRTMGAI